MYERALREITEAIRQLEAEKKLVEAEIRRLRQTRGSLRGSGRALGRVRRSTAAVRPARVTSASTPKSAATSPGKPGRRAQVKGVSDKASDRMIDAWKLYRARRALESGAS
ncbi:MAG: hypothetical protein ABIJ09_00050 [Pseudomonadota bacterium]